MTAKSEVLDRIRRCFSIWSADLKQSSKVNRLADNISSEDIAAKLLDLIYGYELRNTNEEKANYKAVDLVDTNAEDGGGVAVQITTSNTPQKVKKTMKGFEDASSGSPMSDEYSKLIVLLLTTDDKFNNWEKLRGEDYTLSILNLMDLSKAIEHLELSRLEAIAAHLNRELRLDTAAERPRDRISRIARILDADAVAITAGEMTEDDADKFYMVDLNFPVMLRVVSKGRDVAHRQMDERLTELCRSGRPVILTGHSGTGKTTIMLRTAISWVRSGGIALWLSLDENTTLTDAEADQFYQDVLSIIPAGRRALLCLDSPALWRSAFSALGKNWTADPRLQILLAERSNRLSRMTNADNDLLHHWFNGAVVAAMLPENEKNPLRIKDYPVEYIPDQYLRKQEILKRSVAVMFRLGVVRKVSESDAVRQIMKDYNSGSVSLVELIYRAQFWLKDFATRPENLRMDWDEWRQILRRELKRREDAVQLYGVIALCHWFDVPVTGSLFCRFFDMKESNLITAINRWRMNKHVEPVIYREETDLLLPKHDVIAELFFLFHRDILSVKTLMADLLNTMDEFEIGAFLEKNVRKGAIQKDWDFRLGKICYRDLFMTIYRRTRNGTCGLFREDRARLAMGLLYTVPKADRCLADQTLPMVEELDPGLDGSIASASLYTEWGRLLAALNRKRDAEEKLRAVAEYYPRQLHARTELGRLLAKQRGRETEAEAVLREILGLDPDNIQSRTELGRLLSTQKGREAEAEAFLREAIRIDPKNLHPHTELGRLLAKQKGREAEAEAFLREAIRIDPKNLHPHTELGRLLAKQKGREAEAEAFLREAIRIDPKNLHPHTELGRLLAKQKGREAEAEAFLREAIRIDPQNLHPHTELGRLLAKQKGREAEAEAFLLEVMRIDPNHIQSRTELGRLLTEIPGREQEGEKLLKEAFQIDPEQIPSRSILAGYYAGLGRYAEAEKLYRQVLKIAPNDQLAREGLANLPRGTASTT